MRFQSFRLLVVSLLLLAVMSCSIRPMLPPRPDDVLEEEQMLELLVDVHMIEATIQRRLIKGANPNWFGAQQYKLMFDRHGVPQEQFERSYQYYYQDSKKMTELYEKVIEELSKRQSTIGKGGNSKDLKPSNSGHAPS
ncbi:MAG: DUF4296 domain-containing protein [Salibacteraceae bacterium]